MMDYLQLPDRELTPEERDKLERHYAQIREVAIKHQVRLGRTPTGRMTREEPALQLILPNCEKSEGLKLHFAKKRESREYTMVTFEHGPNYFNRLKERDAED